MTISTVLCCLLGCAIALVGTAATFPREVVLGFDQPVGDAQDEE